MLESIKSAWKTAVQKIKDNKEVVIRISAVVVGAAIGAVVAGIVNDAQEDMLTEELELEMIEDGLEELDDDDDDESETEAEA